MVSLDYLHIKVITQNVGNVGQHLETNIHSHRHVGGNNDRDIFRQFLRQYPFLGCKTCGADDDCLPEKSAYLQVFQGDLGGSEVDEDIALFDRFIQVVANFYSEHAASGKNPGVRSEHPVARPLQGPGEFHPFSLVNGDNVPSPHAPRGAADSYFNHDITSLY